MKSKIENQNNPPRQWKLIRNLGNLQIYQDVSGYTVIDSSNDLIVGTSNSIKQASALALTEFYRFIEESNIAMMMEDEE